MTVAALLKKALKEQESGDLEFAEKQYRHICKTEPNHPDAYNLLGCLLMDQEKFVEARHLFQKAIQLKPDVYFFYYHLGLVYACQEKWQDAKDLFIKALELEPSHLESYNNLGIAYKNLKQYDQAVSTFNQAMLYDNTQHDIHYNLGSVYALIGDIGKAGNHLLTALKYAPTSALYHKKIASLYRKYNHYKKSEYHLRQSLKYDPDCVDAMNDFAVTLKDQGKLQQAYQLFDQVTQKKQDYWDVYSNKLFLLHYMPEKTPSFIFQAHVNYGKQLMSQFNDQTHSACHSKQSRIRIGYVSPDFKCHSVAYFIESILRNHNTQKFKIHCYANVKQPDDKTKFFQSLDLTWRDIYDVPDDDVVAQIKRDRIDILIDLAGHSANNRMPIFARKPAPIQITYLGYPNTTGLPSMDYRITDSIVDPEESISLNTEKLLYMPPCFLCYTPQNSPPIKKRSIKKTNIIFGTFNTLAKINDHVIAVWAQILNQLPQSQLLLKNKSFTDHEIQMDIQKKFNLYGVDQSSLIFKPYIDDPEEHLALYQSIDIALDTFPYNGTTTTFEALWMGIPVIGLIGQSHVSRVTYSILNALGLSDLTSHDESSYIKKAIQLARDSVLMRYLNENLRTLMQQSILTDAVAFTRQFEYLMSRVVL